MISVVMPVYNGDKYLNRAIDSIISQTIKDWELIAVDDGSKDSSPEILDEYAKKDTRIKVIHKQNSGVSDARQSGVDVAKGDYIIQFDCDDWAEPDYLEVLYTKAIETDADMVWCDIIGETKDGPHRWNMKHAEDIVSIIKRLIVGDLWGGLWFRMFKSSIYHNENVSFPPKCICWEDLAFLISALVQCKKIAYCDKALYHYDLTNASSITHSWSVKLLENGYLIALSHIHTSLERAGLLEQCTYELTQRKLEAVRDYIDCYPIQDFDKFINTYPEAIDRIGDYSNYPLRLRQCAWLLKHNLKFVVPILLKYYAVLRKLGLSSLTK